MANDSGDPQFTLPYLGGVIFKWGDILWGLLGLGIVGMNVYGIITHSTATRMWALALVGVVTGLALLIVTLHRAHRRVKTARHKVALQHGQAESPQRERP